jgi:hypothetical protein
LQQYGDPPRPSDIPSCYLFVAGDVCGWVEPICPSGQLIKWGLGTNFPQCQCGNLIEHCISYIPNTDSITSAIYPLLCNVCAFQYKVIPQKYFCDCDSQFSISFFSDQKLNGSALGSFNGNLIWSKTGGVGNNSGFILTKTKLDFSNPFSGAGEWSWQWTVADYSCYLTQSYTLSISVSTSTSQFPAYLYLHKVAGSASGYSIVAGFQSQGGINSALPSLTLLWNLVISKEFYTETYFVGKFGTSLTGPFFGSSFTLVASIADEAACRFYTTGGYTA